MKLKILTMMLCVALLSACTKQAESEAPQIDYKAQFEESDRKIGEFLDQLDNPNTPQEVKVKILCHDYPDVYKKQGAVVDKVKYPSNPTVFRAVVLDSHS